MIYPDWVIKYKQKGTSIKHSKGVYRLYKVHSERVKGKSYPVLFHDEYLGIITENGLTPPKSKQVDINDIEVREFGYSFAVVTLCKDIIEDLKKVYQDKALTIFVYVLSRESYLPDNSYLFDMIDTTFDILSIENLQPIFKKIENTLSKLVNFDTLTELNSIYRVRLNNKWYISNINDHQKKILNDLNIEVK